MTNGIDAEAHITNGELFRAVKLIRDDIKDVKAEVSDKPTKRDIEYLERRVTDLENWQTWAMRLGIPGLVTSVVSFVGLIGNKT